MTGSSGPKFNAIAYRQNVYIDKVSTKTYPFAEKVSHVLQEHNLFILNIFLVVIISQYHLNKKYCAMCEVTSIRNARAQIGGWELS